MNKPPVRPINTRAELIALAAELGMRQDWHEPDEQNVTCRVEGTPLNFDNAMGVGDWYGVYEPGDVRSTPQAELHAILSHRVVEDGVAKRGEDIATVNLASLFAWASETPTTGAGVLRAEVERLQLALNTLRTTLRRLGNTS